MAINLSTLVRGPRYHAPRVLIYGDEGTGKTTLACGAESPVFLCSEDGAEFLGPARWHVKSFDDVQEAIYILISEQHEFKSLVIDTVDWIDYLIYPKAVEEYNLTAKNPVDNYEAIPYGRGPDSTLPSWRQIIDGLNVLRSDKDMTVVLLAHAEIKRFDDPEAESYNKSQPKINKSASELLVQWVDVSGYLTRRISIKTTDTGFNKKVTRGTGGSDRLLRLDGRAAFKAKNRYGLCDELLIPHRGGWQVFQDELTRAMTPLPPATEETKTKGRARALEQKESASGK